MQLAFALRFSLVDITISIIIIEKSIDKLPIDQLKQFTLQSTTVSKLTSE